jgi:prevent-host-death family protein
MPRSVARNEPREESEEAQDPAAPVVHAPKIDASKVRERWASTLDRVAHKGKRLVVMRHGKPAAALVSAEDLELLERMEDRLDLEAARASLAEAKKRGTVSWSKIKKAAGL